MRLCYAAGKADVSAHEVMCMPGVHFYKGQVCRKPALKVTVCEDRQACLVVWVQPFCHPAVWLSWLLWVAGEHWGR